ncbi:MAG TPA: hypothetical protein VHQ70_01740 [Syntrophomonadaceae bacterium]|nr:hypothetical protein [Syntrophomonadaceae bacterium]
MIELTTKQGRINIKLNAVRMGKDLCVTITGGTCPHLGAIALGVVRQSLADSQKLSVSISVLTMVGHKEDDVVRMVANMLSSRLGKNVIVSCGIHLDEISVGEISIISNLVEQLTEKLINTINSNL